MGSAVQGQTLVTNVIYNDQFGRTGILNGTTPDTADNWYCTNETAQTFGGGYYTNANANAVWWASDSPQVNQVMMTDGSEIAYTNSPDNGPSGIFLNGYLPFKPQVGHKYIFAVSIDTTKFTSGGNNWLACGFANVGATNTYWAAATPQVGVAWLLQRASGNNIQAYYVGGNITYNLVPATGVTNYYQIVLDTTTGNQATGWTFTWYVFQNGNWAIARTVVAAANPNINWVGVGGDAANGYFRNLTLTDIVEPTQAPSITEQPQNAAVSVGQTATFWVNAAGNPAPTYQWNTISGGVTNPIIGANSAIYTTSALPLADNGLQYNVTIANSAGTNYSAPATLTVANTPATVFSAVKANDGITNALTNLIVTFSKPVEPTTGLNAANYTLNNSATVTSVSNYSSSSNSVLLTTSVINTNSSYKLTVANVRDFYGNAMSSVTVPVLPAGLAIYLRGDSGVILDNSGNVCEWLDQTTNANNAVQNIIGGPSARPTPGTFNSEPVVGFNANNDDYLTAPTSPSLAITNNMSIYAVINFADFNQPREILSKTSGLQAGPYDYYANAAGKELLFRGEGQNSGSVTSSGAAPTSPCVIATTMSGITNGALQGTGPVTHYLNGLANGSGTLTVAAPSDIVDAGNPLWIGGRNDFAQWMNGQMGEVLIFNEALSSQDRTNVDNYLGSKYFSFAFTPNLPASTTSSNGYSITYNATASQGSSHFAYQWQENGTNIPGATGMSYTTPILGPSANGETFDVLVTTFTGFTTNSTTNTLTVLNEPPFVAFAGIPIWNTNQIVVLFNEAVDPTTASIASNYSLNSGSVLSAAMGDAPNKVVLSTSALTWTGSAPDSSYTLTVSNVKDLYASTIVPASTPVALYPLNVALWIKANTGVVTDANGVNTWNDLSGNNNTLITVSAKEPQLATGVNGNPVVHFAATNDTEMDASSSATLAITGDMSVIAVMNFVAGGTNGEICSKTGSGTLKNIPAPYDYAVAGSANPNVLRGNGGSLGAGFSYGSFATAANAVAYGIPQIVAMTDAGNTITHTVNGNSLATGLLGSSYQESSDADAGNDFTIGARGDNINRLTGDIYEMIVVGSALSSDDLASLDTYLAAKYSVVLFNPNPTNIVSSVAGGNLTLSWPADHTGWQLQAQTNTVLKGISTNWANFSGSTATNKVVIPINLTNGTVFYRLLYNP